MNKLTIEKNRRNQILSWAFYDWGNSAYSTTVMAGFFPIFFKQYWSNGADPISTTGRLGVVISASSFLIAICSPFLGAIADLRGFKKLFCLLFTFFGALSCAAMALIPQGDWQSALFAYSLALIAFSAASIFYDSLLSIVAVESDLHWASALGYSLGYLGGGLLFLINVLMYLFPQYFGLSDGVMAIKVSFVTVALWWIVFSIPLAKNVVELKKDDIKYGGRVLIKLSLISLGKTFRELISNRNVLVFVVSYWLYIDGVYTVMTMAVDYGIGIGLQSKDLITALLITQFIGFPFAYLFGKISNRWGGRNPILFCICVYSIAVIAATGMTEAWHFYALATVIGMVQGGVQSLSRSLFGQMIPQGKSAEYFSLFNVVGRFAAILGPLIVAFGVSLTGSSRWGMAGLLVLFVIGGALLIQVREPSKAA